MAAAILPTGKYSTIVIDPPWPYGKWGKASKAPPGSNYRPTDSTMPFKAMTISEIEDMDLSSLAATNCDLYVWVTQRYLPLVFGMIDKWGFKYCQTLTWCKKPKGTGQGGLYCPTTEFLILARRGAMPREKIRMDTTWWLVKRPMVHSRKPELFQNIIESQKWLQLKNQ